MTRHVSRILKKVLRIIAILLPCFCLTFISVVSVNAVSIYDSEGNLVQEDTSSEEIIAIVNGERKDVYFIDDSGIMPQYTQGSLRILNSWFVPGTSNQTIYTQTFKVSQYQTVCTVNEIFFDESLSCKVSGSLNILASGLDFVSMASYGISFCNGSNITHLPSSDYSVSIKDYGLSIEINTSSSYTFDRIQVWVNWQANTTTVSCYPNSINIAGESSDSEYGGLLNSILGYLSSFVDLFDSIVEYLIKLPTAMSQAFQSLFDLIVSAINNMISAITGALSSLGDLLNATLNLIVQGLVTLGNFLIDGLKMLFIPEDDFFSNYFDELYEFFSNKLGILFYPFDLLIRLVNLYLNIGEGSGIITIPDININDWHIIDAQTFNLKETVSTALGSYYDLYYAFVDTIITIALVNYARKMFDEVVGGHSNDS